MGGRWVGGSFSVGPKLSSSSFKSKWLGGGPDWGRSIWFESSAVRTRCWAFSIACFLLCRLLFAFCSPCKEKVIGFLLTRFCSKLTVDWRLSKAGAGSDFTLFTSDPLLFGCCLEDFNNTSYTSFKDSGRGLSCAEAPSSVWTESELDRFNDVFRSTSRCFKSLLRSSWAPFTQFFLSVSSASLTFCQLCEARLFFCRKSWFAPLAFTAGSTCKLSRGALAITCQEQNECKRLYLRLDSTRHSGST